VIVWLVALDALLIVVGFEVRVIVIVILLLIIRIVLSLAMVVH